MIYMQYRRELNVIIVKSGEFFVEFIFGDHNNLKCIQYCKNDKENPKDSWPINHMSETNLGVEKTDLVRFLFTEDELGEVFSFKVVK